MLPKSCASMDDSPSNWKLVMQKVINERLRLKATVRWAESFKQKVKAADYSVNKKMSLT